MIKPRPVVISIVAAMDEKRGIGKNNRIPWHIKEDLVHLKNLTKERVVILGRKTYDSMVFYYDKSGRPMPGKLYLVITRDEDYAPTRENTLVVHSLDEAIEKSKGEEEVFIIGGSQIFELTLPIADKLYLTIVQGDYGADTFFPEYSGFKVEKEQDGESEGHKYKFVDLLKSH